MGSDFAASTILVVDDNEANRALAQHTLEDEGHQVVLASSGAEAIVAFEDVAPACVLLDVRMPEVDGFTVCERIRALPGGADTPILFLTALRDVDTFDRALRSGGDDFLTKPVRPSELVARVQSALEVRKLRTELREHYDLLRRQRDDLLRVQLQKERLTAFVVHDLKNPVSAMDLHAQLLLRDSSLSAAATNSATRIRTEARHLTRMIVNLLDISKADEGQLRVSPSSVDLSALVREVVLDQDLFAQSRNVTISVSIESPVAQADEDLLRRLLTNLVENGLRHAPPNSTLTVDARLDDGALSISVTDAGRGVSPALRERIFDPFVQVESGDSSDRTGRGLGLAFCKRAIEAHGGEIWVEDAVPGARFCVRIPQ